jgi:prolyl-tRNA editing enzyme YbaK/EbsC (Cys-tRNA(Pro) deacylase)
VSSRGLPEAVDRIARFLAEARAEARLQEFAQGTPTARDAAEAVGCELDQIVKSLLFLCDQAPVLVMVPGSRRADEQKIARTTGAATARKAAADVVREATGYPVGGVAPFATARVSTVLCDRSLLPWKIVWVGAGSDRHLAGLAPIELLRLTRARTADICVDADVPLRPSGDPPS